MEIFSVPGSGKYVCEGSIIEFARLPGVKYMVHTSNNDHYPNSCNSWYAESLQDSSRIPLTKSDVAACTIIYNPDLNSCCPPPPPPRPPQADCDHHHHAQSFCAKEMSVEHHLISHGDTTLGDTRNDKVSVRGTPNFETEVIISDRFPKIKATGGSQDLKFEGAYGEDIILYGVADARGENNAVNLRVLKQHITDLSDTIKRSLDKKISAIRIGKNVLPTDENGDVEIPIATVAYAGVVKGSYDDNMVAVDESGEMEINGITQDKIVQNEGDVIFFDCGTSSDII